MSHPSVLDWDTAGARCRRQKARTPAAPQLTRSQTSTKQTPDQLSPESRSWHGRPQMFGGEMLGGGHPGPCWWDPGRVPANYSRLPNANGGQAFTCPPSLGPSGRHQGREGLPSPTSSSHWRITFGARTSSLMFPRDKKFLNAVGSICRVGWVRGIS